MTEGFNQPLRDTLWGHVYLTPALADLTLAAPFMRLHRIMQLGPVYRLYPGATHMRAGHSVGVYHLGRRLLQNLAERGADAWLGASGAMSFLCACLLHDLGHFPYAHSLKELPLESHEALTRRLVLAQPLAKLISRCGADPELTAAIVDRDFVPASGAGTELLFYRKLLSGCLDPDKLDYLSRDAAYCGVPYGMQDVDFILSRISPHPERGTDIDSRLIPNVEAILFAKYLMYRTVYWHREVRACTSMIKKVLLSALAAGRIAGEELYGLDDAGLFALLRERTGSPLAEAVMEGALYSQVAEIPYDAARHSGLKDIGKRSLHEAALADKLRSAGLTLGDEDLVIDLPEPVSFETGLFVADRRRYFSAGAGAFDARTMDTFVRSLYVIRVFASVNICRQIKTPDGLCDILYDTEGWLRP